MDLNGHSFLAGEQYRLISKSFIFLRRFAAGPIYGPISLSMRWRPLAMGPWRRYHPGRRALRLSARTQDFHSCKRGSTPLGRAIQIQFVILYSHQGRRRPVQVRANPSSVKTSPMERPPRVNTRNFRPNWSSSRLPMVSISKGPLLSN